MNYEIEKLDGSVKLTFSVGNDEWQQEMEGSYRKNKNRYSVPGFRRGFATRRMIENLYGESAFFDDAFSSCFKKAYSEALDANPDIYPVDEPQIDLEDIADGGIKFSAVVTVKPEVVLGEYKGLKIDKVTYPVTDEVVNAELEKARERLARKVEVKDRAAQDGDITTIDYSGSVDGVKFEGGTAEGQELVLGSKTFIPGFEDQVIGMNIGETRDINVKFPEEYHAENLKGKDAVFTVTLHGIMVKELPALDDNFAKDASKFDSLAEYTKDIRTGLEESAKHREDAENENNLLDKIVEGVTCNIPDCMVDTQLDYTVEDFKNRLRYMYNGLRFEDYLKYIGSDEASFRKERADEARKNVKTRLTVEEIIKRENIEATDADVEEKIAELAKAAGKEVDEYKKNLSGNQLSYIKNDIVVIKVMKFLADNNTFVAKK